MGAPPKPDVEGRVNIEFIEANQPVKSGCSCGCKPGGVVTVTNVHVQAPRTTINQDVVILKNSSAE